MIVSSKGKLVEAIIAGRPGKGFAAGLVKTAERKLAMLHAASSLDDLASPPGNRLEKLRGDRSGCHSIRINDQWRVCFRWTDAGAEDVGIVDYHRG